MKDMIIDVVFLVAMIAICGAILIGFSTIVGKVAFKDQTSRCGLVNSSNGQCLDGQYTTGTTCEVMPVVPCDGKYWSK